jgi:hypothetical protein
VDSAVVNAVINNSILREQAAVNDIPPPVGKIDHDYRVGPDSIPFLNVGKPAFE